MSDHRFKEEIRKKVVKKSPLNINNQDFYFREREMKREKYTHENI